MKIRRFLLFILLSSCIFVTAGCTTPEKSFAAYRDTPFRAQICGELCSLPFGAELSFDGRIWSLHYLSPSALAGITLQKNADGVTVTEGEEALRLDAEALSGLLSPLDALLLWTEPMRILQTGEETELTLSKDTVLTLGETGAPRAFRSPTLCFSVIRWEER